jgi:hypothetical protein
LDRLLSQAAFFLVGGVLHHGVPTWLPAIVFMSPGLFVAWHPDSLGPIATSVIKQDLFG